MYTLRWITKSVWDSFTVRLSRGRSTPWSQVSSTCPSTYFCSREKTPLVRFPKLLHLTLVYDFLENRLALRRFLLALGLVSAMTMPLLRRFSGACFAAYIAGKVSVQLLSLRYAGFRHIITKPTNKNFLLAWYHIIWCFAGHFGTLLSQYLANII